ncbi:MAG: hypothetical protein FWD51_05420, partial [Betaproteobacteria bacterium]|nr:hypothetical protein [Betaproteobacteria bacterium]
MKLVWKLSIPQMCIVVCVGLISYAVVTSSLNSLRAQYVSDVIENRFRRVVRDITASELEAVKLTSLFTDMPLVIQAYETALSGDIDDANSPQAQAARELLRKELAPMLDSYEKETGNKLKLHFHLPNARSLVRLWRDKNVHINGESLDISDDLSEYRHTVLDVLKSGKAVMGIELGSGGFAIRGVVPVKAPDGRLLGSAEVLQDFQPVLDDVMADGKIELILYLNEDRVSLAANGNRSDANSSNLLELRKNPQKGNFFRITEPRDEISDSFITPELLSKENNGQFVERRGSIVLATLPINDYQDTQLGVLVCVINTAHVTRLVDTATIVLTLMLMLMVIAPSLSLLLGLRVLVINPLNRIKAKIRDIAEDRADLSEQIQSCQKDEIGALARWFNVLTAKVNTMLDQMREADERTQIMLDATPMVATILDKNLNRLDCSQEALKLFAVPSKQEFLERFFDFSPEYQPCGELSIEKVRKLFGKAFEEGYARTEWMLQTLGGEPIPSEVTLVRVKYRDDYIVAGYVHDLRERKAAMAQLAAESARFEAMAHWYGSILDAIPFPISVQDSDAKWTFVNAANEKLLGKSRKNILGQYCSS